MKRGWTCLISSCPHILCRAEIAGRTECMDSHCSVACSVAVFRASLLGLGPLSFQEGRGVSLSNFSTKECRLCSPEVEPICDTPRREAVMRLCSAQCFRILPSLVMYRLGDMYRTGLCNLWP